MSTADPLLSLIVEDDARYLRVLIGRLPEMERLVCRLYHHENLGLDEIAVVLLITERRAEQLLAAGIDRLRAMAPA